MASQPKSKRPSSAGDAPSAVRGRRAPSSADLERWLIAMEREAQAMSRLVGRNLRAARSRAGLSQNQLHERAGIAQSHLSHLERGLVYPKLGTLAVLARVLGIAVVDLFSADGPPPPRASR